MPIASLGRTTPKAKDRTAEFIPNGHGGGMLVLTRGTRKLHVSGYQAHPIPAPGEALAFRLVKVFGGTDKEADSYDVLLSPSGYHACECKGFLHHGHCTHVDALRAFALPDSPAVPGGPLPEKLQGPLVEGPACDFCGGGGLIAWSGDSPEACPACGGSGVRTERQVEE